MSYTGAEDAGKYKINNNYIIEEDRQGNGRMSRLLTLLLLYKNGFDVGKYFMLTFFVKSMQ